MSDLERIESEWKIRGIVYHKVTSEGWVGIRIMKKYEKPGFIHVFGRGDIELKDYGQLGDFIEFDPNGDKASASDTYTEWWNWLKQNDESNVTTDSEPSQYPDSNDILHALTCIKNIGVDQVRISKEQYKQWLKAIDPKMKAHIELHHIMDIEIIEHDS